MLKFLNKKKKKSSSLSSSLIEPIKIRTTSNAVIKLINFYRNDENDTFGSMVLSKEDDLYNTFFNFIQSNRIGNKLPRSSEIESHLKIGAKKRKEILKKLFENGVLIKPTVNSYEFKDN